MSHYPLTRSLSFLLALAFITTGCGLSKDSQTGALLNAANSLAVTASNCGFGGFAQFLHPKLVQNCATCHAGGQGPGGFAVSDPMLAISGATSRANFNSPANSLLVTKSAQSGHGPGCSACGNPTLTADLTNAITQWAQARAGTHAICASYSSSSTSGSTTYSEGNDYGISGSSADDVPVSPAGLSYYKNSLHDVFIGNCISCHVPGMPAALAPFAVDDLISSYRAAKPRASLGSTMNAAIYDRASTVNHGPGCTACGPSFGTQMLGFLNQWAAAEQVTNTPRVVLPAKTVPVIPAGSTGVVMLWSTAELGAISADLQGVEFQVKVKDYVVPNTNPQLVYYDFFEPRLNTPTAGAAIYANNILSVLNGTEQTLVTTFASIQNVIFPGRTVLSNPSSPILSTGHLLLPKPNPTNMVGFSFKILQKN